MQELHRYKLLNITPDKLWYPSAQRGNASPNYEKKSLPA